MDEKTGTSDQPDIKALTKALGAVLDFQTAKANQAAKKAETDKKPDMATLYDSVAEALNHEVSSILPTFPHSYRIVEVDNGEIIVLREGKDQVVSLVLPSTVSADILSYCNSILKPHSDS